VQQADGSGVAGAGVASGGDPAGPGGRECRSGVGDCLPGVPAAFSAPGGADQPGALAADQHVPGSGVGVAGCLDEVILAVADDPGGDFGVRRVPDAGAGFACRRCRAGGRRGGWRWLCWVWPAPGWRPGDGGVLCWWTGPAAGQVGVAFLRAGPGLDAQRGGDLLPGRAAIAGGLDEVSLGALDLSGHGAGCGQPGERGCGIGGGLGGAA